MTFSFIELGATCLIYISVLFFVAFATDKGLIPERLVLHPAVYVCSLGIFASAAAYYGVISLAEDFGYGALAYYMGTGILFLFAPIALKPLIELSRRFQITSMADLLTFRYHSHEVGGLIALCMFLTVLPLLALQLQAVADTIHLLTVTDLKDANEHTGFDTRDILAGVYCMVIACFAMLYGSSREHHKGLITAMALESLVKLFGLLTVGAFSVYVVFGGMSGLDTWLNVNPEQLQQLYEPLKESRSHMLLLVFLSTAVAMPHIFHMAVTENAVRHSVYTVTWAFPLFLLLMALPIFPILWAGLKLNIPVPTEYFTLAVPLVSGNKAVTIISFIAGLSAATGAMVSIALAISTMVMNHWILPAASLQTKNEIYGQLVTIKRVLIVAVLATAYVFYWVLNKRYNLMELALISFIAALQMMPGIICVAHWPRGNRRGLLAGLFVGMSIWVLGLILPLYIGTQSIALAGGRILIQVGIEHWDTITLYSLSLNVLTFVLVSIFTPQSDDERYSAEICSEDELSHPVRMVLDIRDPEELVERLTERIGDHTAGLEVERALRALGLNSNERRPYALRRLRDEVEANLSGLLGISLASEIMDTLVPLRVPESDGAADIKLIEERLHHYRDHLSGLAAELDSLRLYHRRTLEELPLAVCSIGKDEEVLMWNSAMQRLSGIADELVTGSRLEQVLEPWGPMLSEFARSEDAHLYKQAIEVADHTRWISLHKAAIPSSPDSSMAGQVILLEDVTELQMLESELLHSERLASVGRLAAGVAHEIGNPITGIDCLAQNLKYESDDPEVLETASQILSQTERVSRIVHSLVSFSHAGREQNNAFHAVDIHQCAQEAINLIALQKERTQVNFNNLIPRETYALGDDQKIIQIFVNLLSNARDACETDAQISALLESADTRWVQFAVVDDGPGIPLEIQDRILEPFFTTKDPGEGTGLGLAMVYSIVEDHHGQLELVSPNDKALQRGTKFVIKLPSSLAYPVTLGNTSKRTK